MIEKSKGVTETEKYLAALCSNTFLNAWCFPNPFKDDKKEACDMLAIFNNHAFIFFDREKQIADRFDSNPEVFWQRWVSGTIDAQIKTCHGAEKYIKSGRKLYLDKDLKIQLPLKYSPDKLIVHKIIVAHGVSEICKSFSKENQSGSLAVIYSDKYRQDPTSVAPFVVRLDRKNPIHVFDSNTLPIILNELDTYYDFTAYLTEKEEALSATECLSYSGEEDLLAHYFQNHHGAKVHAIDSGDDASFIMIAEGMWNEFVKSKGYQARIAANKSSYLWDRLLQKSCTHALQGTAGGNSNIFGGVGAVYEMAKEPRFSRRGLSDHMLSAINKFPDAVGEQSRFTSIMPSFYPNRVYVFLQLDWPKKFSHEDYRAIRMQMLEIACGAAKIRSKNLETVIGIGVEPPKHNTKLSEDFILMDCSKWTDQEYEYYDSENRSTGLNFFLGGSLVETRKTIQEFPDKQG